MITNKVLLHLDPKDPKDTVMRNTFCRVIVDSWIQYPKGSKGLEGRAPWVSKAARNVCLVIKLPLQASEHDSSDGWACELFL